MVVVMLLLGHLGGRGHGWVIDTGCGYRTAHTCHRHWCGGGGNCRCHRHDSGCGHGCGDGGCCGWSW